MTPRAPGRRRLPPGGARLRHRLTTLQRREEGVIAEPIREIAEKLVLAGVGAVALTAERADTLAEELSARGGIGRDEARSVVEEVVGRWRSETVRLGERTGAGLAGLFRELGLVTRDELEEIELRVAQIEHRLRLLEKE